MSQASEFYKRTLIISFLIVIVASVSFYYLGELVIQKADKIIGIHDSGIGIRNITKSFDNIQLTPKINVEYTTLKKTTSYIRVDEIRSESNYDNSFSKTLVFDSSYAGRTVNLTITSIKDDNSVETLVEEVTLPRRIDASIRISG